MKLCFSYNAEKDAENFMNGLKSVNNPKPTKFHQLYIDKHGDKIDADMVKKFVAEYIEKNGIDVENKVTEIEQGWFKVGSVFIERCEKIFGIKYPREIIDVYLTTNGRCTYNIQKGYFFVGIESKNPSTTIMHELLHFYTWEAFYKILKKQGLSDLQYNDIKESLTELLNIEFADLMGGHIDTGYPQHAEMRLKIRKLWEGNKNLFKVIAALSEKTSSSDQEKSLKSLIPFGMDLLEYSKNIGLFPIAYGSLAYLYHTGDKVMAINDIDFLIPKNRFQDLIEMVKKHSDLRYEETTYNSIKVFRDNLKIAFDSIEDYLKDIDFKTQKIELGGGMFDVVDKTTLVEVYRRGADTIPFKKEAYTKKLDSLKS